MKPNQELDDYLRALAESVGVDMDVFDLPASHGNDRLRRAALVQLRIHAIQDGLKESVALQSHYASLLNQHDGGGRIGFDGPEAWLARLAEVAK